MGYVVTSELHRIDFGATGIEEVLQNVRMILATVAFSCPMDRDFAWSPPLDGPIDVAMARARAQIVDAIQTYEPRAQVTSVTFDHDAEGVLKPIVEVIVDDGAV